MDHDHIEQILRAGVEHDARRPIDGTRPVPPMSEPLGSAGPSGSDGFGPRRLVGRPRRRRPPLWLIPVAAVVAIAAVIAGVLVATRGNGSGPVAAPAANVSNSASGTSAPTGSASASASSAPPSSATPATTVRVTSLENDGDTYGVGMPVVLYFSPAPTNAAAFEKAVSVTVDGKAADGAWYWEQPTAAEVKAHTVEAHYRLSGYWPADSSIHVGVPIGGLSAGTGLVYSDKLTSLDYKIGDSHISTVNADGLSMTVTDNGKTVKTFGVSLGKATTPTFNGTKIVMQKGEDVPGTNTLRKDGTVMMSGPGYTDDPVEWSVRITESGEYVHAAPWNNGIGERSTSNGCTNLTTANAKWFYAFSQLGDVVTYANTDGTTMPSWDGLGDWNVSWSQWTQGGLL